MQPQLIPVRPTGVVPCGHERRIFRQDVSRSIRKACPWILHAQRYRQATTSPEPVSSASARSSAPLGGADEEVMVAVAIQPLIGLLDEDEACVREPSGDLVPAGVEVIPAGVRTDILAMDEGDVGRHARCTVEALSV